MHYTMFHGKHTGTLDDLLYLPALPFYLCFAAVQLTLLYMLAWEVADAMGVPFVVARRKKYVFPAQPHPFGTAPDFVVEVLSTMKWAPGKAGPDGIRPPQELVMKTVKPRVMYVFALWILLLPLPLMVFGAGSNDNAAWWSISAAAGLIALLFERSIAASERQIDQLAGTFRLSLCRAPHTFLTLSQLSTDGPVPLDVMSQTLHSSKYPQSRWFQFRAHVATTGGPGTVAPYAAAER